MVAQAKAPPTSHIGRFGISGDEIHVTFKDKAGGETRPYVYQFESNAEAEQVFEEMRGSPHPYGNVLKPDVIDAGIPHH